MPLKQFFTGSKLQDANLCRSLTIDDIDWTDADVLVNQFQQFAKNIGLGIELGYVLDKVTINNLLGQDGKSFDGIKIYLAYSNIDKTIRLVPVACQYDAVNNDYNDYNIPLVKPVDISTLPKIGNLRPCPPQCGTKNFLNQ